MYQTQRFVNVIVSQLFGEYIYRMLALMTAMIFLTISNTSFALAPNPGATCEGVTGASQGSLTNADYTNLVSAVNTNNYVNIAGNASGSIPLQIKMNTLESSASTTTSNFGVITTSGTSAVNIRRTFPNTAAFTDITLEFRNSITTQPIYLTNVALSAFDIDYANSNGNSFDDYVQITGITQAGTPIEGVFQSITGSNISYAQGLFTTSTFNCPAKDLGTACQGSVRFSQPVASVRIRYTNTGRLSASPTNQEIDFRVDNYCYIPQYVFSGTVFDDNGGITGNNADATNSNITTGPYANNNSYFNGAFNPPQETGIASSTVRLANCANTSTTYPTQSVIRDNAPIGEYQISIPKTTLANNNNLCLLESRSGTTYPIRTSNEITKVGFSSTTYNYPNNNFGRVIMENAALVLRKAQYVNDCPANINYTASNLNAAGNTNPRTGFSEGSITGNLDPGQCIAYRITATNRANIVISDFVMRDVLQKKGVNSAQVTSVLANPPLSTTDYNAADNPAIGANGEVKTRTLAINARTKRDFYFNTKYGTTSDP